MSVVMETLECPSLLLTTTTFCPCCSVTEAWKCRKPLAVTPGYPARPPSLVTAALRRSGLTQWP